MLKDGRIKREYTGINRIRLEFKSSFVKLQQRLVGAVLIESDWNLNAREEMKEQREALVLIESDWNLN